MRYLSGGGRSGYSDCEVNWTKEDGAGLRRRYTWKSDIDDGLDSILAMSNRTCQINSVKQQLHMSPQGGKTQACVHVFVYWVAMALRCTDHAPWS